MRLNRIISMKEQYKFYIYFSLCMKIILPYNCLFSFVGPKNLATPAHFISSPRPTPRKKKCPRTNEEGPNCQETLLRTSCSQQPEITEGESDTPPRAVSQSVLRESTSAMRQSWEYSGRAIPG